MLEKVIPSAIRPNLNVVSWLFPVLIDYESLSSYNHQKGSENVNLIIRADVRNSKC